MTEGEALWAEILQRTTPSAKELKAAVDEAKKSWRWHREACPECVHKECPESKELWHVLLDAVIARNRGAAIEAEIRATQ
jgi:hypothetical protein